jgi:predicted nucleic acid-binding protein
MNAVDTNVLIYVRDPRDPRKQSIAASLVESINPGVLLWQVACEYIAASRKLAATGHSVSAAFADIRELRQVWHTVTPSWAIFERAAELGVGHGLAFWDSLIVAACLESGVRDLYSEDYGDRSEIEGLRITDPFR